MQVCQAFIGAAVTLLLPGVASPADEQTPRVEHVEVRFGIVDTGTILAGTSIVKNTTNRAVRIIRVRGSCGCVKVVEHPSTIAAGESAEVKVSLSTGGKHGKVTQFVVLETDDSELRAFEVQVSATCRGLWANPGVVSFSDADFDSGEIHRVRVIASGLTELDVTSVTCDSDAVEVEKLDVGAPQGTEEGERTAALIEIRLTRNLTVGRSSATIVANTDEPDFPALRIPVLLDRTSLGLARPSRILFGLVKAHAEESREIIVTLPADTVVHDADQIELKATHEFVSVSLKQAESGANKWVLKASVQIGSESTAPKLLKGDVTGSIGDKNLFAIPYLAILDTR